MNNSLINLAFFSESTLIVLLTELIDESRDLNVELLKGLSVTGSKLNICVESSCLAVANAVAEFRLEFKNEGTKGFVYLSVSSSSKAFRDANNSCFCDSFNAISLGSLKNKKKLNENLGYNFSWCFCAYGTVNGLLFDRLIVQ